MIGSPDSREGSRGPVEAPGSNREGISVADFRLLALALALAIAVPALASAAYIRDEIRINMRTGPGSEYTVLKSLTSGDQVTRLGGDGEWTRIRTTEGREGWVPAGYLSDQPPASLELPDTRSKLERAESTIGDLERRLAGLGNAVTELEALRARVDQLDTENLRLSAATRWKDYLAGAALLAVGVLVGLSVPRGGGGRGRKIKL
jgi:SH3 domain protein